MDCLISENVSGTCGCGQFARALHMWDDGQNVAITCEACCVVCHPPNAPHAESIEVLPAGEQASLFQEVR
jgi:hypothetical protein